MKTVVRKKPGNMETRLSMAVMGILVIIGAGVMICQYQINPAVIALRPEAHQQDLPLELDEPVLIDTKDSGIAPFSPPERFGPDTLYEKINGRADLYLASGFVSLNTQRFSMNRDADLWVEVFVYDMATPANAFSVFSMQRREDAQASDIVAHAYRTQNALFMVHANVYMEIIGMDASLELQQVIVMLAHDFLKTRGGTTQTRAPGADLFADNGLKADSLQLIAVNAFGFEQLDGIYTCNYLIDGEPLTAFVSERQNSEAATALAAEYRQVLLSYGATAVDVSLPVEGVVVMQFFDTYEVIFSRGRYLAGIHEATNLEAAEILARRLAGHLEGADAR